MSVPTLSTVNQIASLIIDEYERYLPSAFDGSLTMLEKVNKVIEKLNEVGLTTNSLIDNWNKVNEWIINEGLTNAVDKKLDEFVADGTFASIVDDLVGDLSTLLTLDKTTIVNALNEVKNEVDTNTENVGDLTLLTTTNKSDLVNAINEVKQTNENTTGELNLLLTTEKGNLVDAINEVKDEIHNTVSSNVGDLTLLSTLDKSDLVHAINEVNEDIQTTISSNVGDLTLLSTLDKSDLVHAINEVNEKVGDDVNTLNTNINERGINVKDFGAKGDGITDDSVAINNALNYAKQNNYDLVYIPSGHYVCNKPLNIPNSVNLFGAGKHTTKLDFSNGVSSDFIDIACITAYGDGLEDLPYFTGTINENSMNIQFTSIPANLKQGDVIVIYDSADYSYSGFRSYYHAGEYGVIDSINGVTAKLVNFPFETYNAGGTVNLYKLVNPTKTTLKDFEIVANANVPLGIHLKNAVDSIIENISASNGASSTINIEKSYNVSVKSVYSEKITPDTYGTSYGMVLSNSQEIRVEDCFMVSVRHAIAIGGNDGIGCVPNRRFHITNSTLQNISGTTESADIHGNSEYITYESCFIDKGASLGGNHNRFINNVIKSGGETIIYAGELKGFDIEIEGNKFIKDGGDDASRGSFIDIGGNSSPLSANTIDGGMFKITNNKMVYSTSITNAIKIVNRGSIVNLSLVVENNQIISRNSDNGIDSYALFIYAFSGNPFKELNVNNNSFQGGLYIRDINNINVNNNIIYDVKQYGILAGWSLATGNVENIIITHNLIKNALFSGINLTGVVGGGIDNIARIINNTIISVNNGNTNTSTTNVPLRVAEFGEVDIYGNRSLKAGINQVNNLNIANVNILNLLRNEMGEGIPKFTNITNQYGGISTNIVDTNGLTTVAELEIEVNKLKAELRKHKLMG